jgi:hypothetical protein
MNRIQLIILLVCCLAYSHIANCQEADIKQLADARIYAFIGEEISTEKFPVDTADKEKYDEDLIQRIRQGRIKRRLYESYLVRFKITKPIFNKFEGSIVEFVVVGAADGKLDWRDQKYNLVYLIKSRNSRYLIYHHSNEVFQDTKKNWFSIFEASYGYVIPPKYTKLQPNYFKLKPQDQFRIPVEVYSHISAEENARNQKQKYPRLYYTLKLNEYAIPKYCISAVDLFAARKLEIYKYRGVE